MEERPNLISGMKFVGMKKKSRGRNLKLQAKDRTFGFGFWPLLIFFRHGYR